MSQNQTAILCITLAGLGLALACTRFRITALLLGVIVLALLLQADWS